MLKKHTKIRSRKIRQAAKNKPCSLRLIGICNHDPQTTVFCHLNTQFKGVATKSSDLFGIFSCSNCHRELDNGNVSKADKLRSLIETQQILTDEGLIKAT